MKSFTAAFQVENGKLLRSPVSWATLGFFLFVTSISAGQPDWPSYLGNVSFLFASVLGLMGFGVLLSWVFGREYADRTMKDLLALPVSRGKIVMAKYITVVLWCILMTLIAILFALLLGEVMGLPGFTAAIARHFLAQTLVLAILHVCVSAPLAFLASWSRGYLVPLAFAFATLMIALTIGPTSFGAYLPWSIPALHLSLSDTAAFPLGTVSYGIILLLGMLGLGGTLVWWRRADHA